MQSPSGHDMQFSQFYRYMPYQMFWNVADRGHPQLPPLPSQGAFPFPAQQQLPLQLYSPQSALYNMLAQEAAVNNRPLKIASEPGERRSNYMMGSPVTPPLTPLIADGVHLKEAAATNREIAVTDTQLLQPTRVSSRNRRPPAFIEGESTCPICGSLLRASELAEHYQKELNGINNGIEQSSTGRKKRETRISSRINEKKIHLQEESRKNVLARVHHNRKSRALKFSNRRKESSVPNTSSSPSLSQPAATTTVTTNELLPTTSGTTGATAAAATQRPTACPVCNETLNCSNVEMTQHVESCLSKQSSDLSSNQETSGSDEEYETYTWCGETRVRATSFLDSSELAASGFNTIKKSEEDDDTPLVVDDDMNEKQFGEAQYSEADIIPCASEEPGEAKAQVALRNAVISSSEERKPTEHGEEMHSKWTDEPTIEDGTTSFRCLICMDRYSTPLVSVQCWHVHCEECWLRTLGAKKLCPQCNMITSPSDLRRIYL